MLYNIMLQFEYYYKKPYFYKKAKRAKRQKGKKGKKTKCLSFALFSKIIWKFRKLSLQIVTTLKMTKSL